MDKRSGRRLPFATEDSTPTRGGSLTPISIWLEFFGFNPVTWSTIGLLSILPAISSYPACLTHCGETES
jgi:hypothetical protein